MHTFVIAEAASTHDGDYNKALRLIDLGASIGADAVKFQYASNAERLCERRHAPEYLESYKLLEMTPDWIKGLANSCRVRGVEFMCTVYLPEDVAHIAPYVKQFKIASFESRAEDLIKACRVYDKEIIVSEGLGSWSSLAGEKVKYLHCVSAYPTPLTEINLRLIQQGLSDHTKHPWTGGLAVAAGAQIIEFHMRLHDTKPINADYPVSRDPEEAREYVANIRTAESMMGDGIKRIMPAEEPMLKYRVTS